MKIEKELIGESGKLRMAKCLPLFLALRSSSWSLLSLFRHPLSLFPLWLYICTFTSKQTALGYCRQKLAYRRIF